jgi:Protein of unknown function (DUF2612)
MRELAWYLSKVPPEHAGDANFMAELALVLQPFVDAQAFINSLPQAFDLDTAVGVQLDATGAWAGITREVPVPVQNPWFSFDTSGLGFDQGYWQGPYDGIALAALDDTTFRRLIRAKIAANNCNGLQASILSCLTTYFDPLDYPSTYVAIYDATDPIGSAGLKLSGLEMGVVIAGTIPNAVDLAILSQLLIPFKPAGAFIIWGVTTVSGLPVFGFDVDNQYISGFDVGAWAGTPAQVAALSPYSTDLHPIMAELMAGVNPLDLGLTNQTARFIDDLGTTSTAATASVNLGTAP